MNGLATELMLVGVLILINAFFAGSELALVSLREGQAESLRRRGKAGQRVADEIISLLTKARKKLRITKVARGKGIA